MKILLLSKNDIARDFIKLAFKEQNPTFLIIKDISDIVYQEYDFAFIDDLENFSKEQKSDILKIDSNVSVIFYSNKNSFHKFFDFKIKKPFLPKDIKEIINQSKKTPKEILPKVLNSNDVEHIQKLLDENNLFNDDKNSNVRDKLLEAILDMKPKKIRKLLKGARVTLNISFSKDNDEK